MSLDVDRVQRRVNFEVRRDAAQVLSNGRVRYDALFSRTGYQTYPKPGGGVSVEYRPPQEVFRSDSLASLALLPGTLLHPSTNFGTHFGEGAYRVRGTTGESVVMHTDRIHTAGTLMVWDQEWNDLIQSREVADISLGYIITPGPGGEGPDGQRYDVLHTDIEGDHAAGVPDGNAGTARVVLDAIWDPAARRATRRALADIAAMRMDAAPMIFDLGRWPARDNTEKKDTDTMDARTLLALNYLDAVAKLGPHATPKAMIDAWVEICGTADDPAIKAAAAALASAPSSEAAPAVVEVSVGAEMQDAASTLEAERRAIADERAKLDAERKAMHDAVAERDGLVQLAREAIGLDWTTRADAASAPKSTDEIKREIVAKLDSAKLAKIDGYTDPLKRAVALDLAVDDCRAKLDANRERGGGLLRIIETTRNNNATEQQRLDEEVRKRLEETAKRADAIQQQGRAV